MSIKNDALKILAILYNNKIKGINEVRSDDSEIEKLELSEIEFNNATEFLKGKKLSKINRKIHTRVIENDISNDSDEKTPEEIEEDKKFEYEDKIRYMKIEVKGIEVIEDDKKLKTNFGDDFIKKTNTDKKISIINKTINVSSPTIKNVNHENTGDINYGNITKNTITEDNSKTYSIDKMDLSTHESRSISLINKYGEKKPLIVGAISLLAGIFTIITGFSSLLNDINVFSWIPSWLAVPEGFSPYLIGLGIIISFIGGYIISLIQYKYDSQCPKCKKHYALKEYGDPTVKDVETKEGIRRTTTRNYQCKYCGYKEPKKKNRFIPNSEIEK